MGLFDLFKASKTVVIVDGVSLNEALGMKGKVPPRNQLQLLRRLARFAQREKISVVAVLSGSPLHKAPAGKKFEEITVLYSKSPEAHVKYVVKTARSKGNGALLISDNAALEKMVGSSLRVMRMSTFRKVFDLGGNEGEGSERSERSGRSERGGTDRKNRSRPPRRRPQKKSGEAQSGQQKPEHPPKESSETDAINELIDLVD